MLEHSQPTRLINQSCTSYLKPPIFFANINNNTDGIIDKNKTAPIDVPITHCSFIMLLLCAIFLITARVIPASKIPEYPMMEYINKSPNCSTPKVLERNAAAGIKIKPGITKANALITVFLTNKSNPYMIPESMTFLFII